MRFSLREIALQLSCPDDGAAMAASASGMTCEQCDRFYPLLSANILELLPTRPIAFPEISELARYREGYRSEFFRPSEIRADTTAWGAPEARSPKWVRLRERQAREVFQFLQEEPCKSNLVFCDLSAGAGYCTFRAAQEYRMIFHCELSLDALVYASAKARASRLENVVFVHADYFQPPFRNSIDHLTCLDTLIRGAWHETRLLRSIQRVLSRSGAAVVDFHNWWHNPLRRLGLLPDNFVGNKSYTRKEMTALLGSSGIGQFETRSFVQEVDPHGTSGKVLARFIPPTRLMVRMEGISAVDSQTVSARQQAASA